MAKAQHKHIVIHSIANSNTWLIGLLLMLASIVVVALYSYSTFQAVKGVSTKTAELKPNISPAQDEGTRLSNGCFVVKGNVAVLESCGTRLYKYVQYSCGDGTKVKLGSSTTCKSGDTWLATIATSCRNHTSCDAKATPTPSVFNR